MTRKIKSIVQNAESLEIQASSQHASVRKIVAGVAEPDEAVVLALCGGLCDLTVCGAAHVERSEGKLRARLTD